MKPSILSRPRPGAPRRVATICVAFAIVAALAAPATALAAFDPAYVISDDNFRAATSMSVTDVQSFLAAVNAKPSASTALKLLVTEDHNGTRKTAATIVSEAASAWQVSPKVLLVMLQKEQSLLTRTSPSQASLDWALGFGCPDGVAVADRNPAYKGFGAQVWNAAMRLNAYGELPGVGTPWNKTFVFSDHGFTALPRNLATYKLYKYTPHVGYPETSGTGALNYIHGNLLFWNVWNQWPAYLGDPLAGPSQRPVYRFFNARTGTHFYTASEGERYSVATKLAAAYKFEGVAYSVNTSNTANSTPLYRFYNRRSGTHFYTASQGERDSVATKLASTYAFEGVAYNVSLDPTGATPVYRFYKPRQGTHFYTANEAEKNDVIAKYRATYRFEGIVFYVAP